MCCSLLNDEAANDSAPASCVRTTEKIRWRPRVLPSCGETGHSLNVEDAEQATRACGEAASDPPTLSGDLGSVPIDNQEDLDGICGASDGIDERPLTSTATDCWTIVVGAEFVRDQTEDSDPSDLCSQCVQVDFKAIFSLDFERHGAGLQVCSFSGLSRSMLASQCSACRVIATAVFTDFDTSKQAALQQPTDRFRGNLVTYQTDWADRTSAFLGLYDTVRLRVELLILFRHHKIKSFLYTLHFLRSTIKEEDDNWETVYSRWLIIEDASGGIADNEIDCTLPLRG